MNVLSVIVWSSRNNQLIKMVHQPENNLVCTQLPDDQRDKRIVAEFCHLLEKSKQLFNGLR